MSIRTTKSPIEAKLITHSGTFHADEVLATVIISKTLKGNPTVLRTSKVPEQGLGNQSIVYDVGGGKFDHHQKEGNGKRENGIPYASAGLIWKEYGMDILLDMFYDISDSDVKFIFNYVDKNLIQGVDADDNGVISDNQCEIHNMSFSEIIQNFNPTWDSNVDSDTAFVQAVLVAEIIFDKLLESALAKAKARSKVADAIIKSENCIMILEQHLDWQEAFFSIESATADEIKFVIFPSNRGDYKVRCIPDKLNGFGQRKPLPVEWRGLKAEELQKTTGVADAVFCHPNGFVAGADTFEGALALAKLAVEG